MNSVSTTTLIIATYNWPEALYCCLSTVAKQKVLPTEVIIADDGSDYQTREVIIAFQKSLPVSVVHVWQEDQGFRKSQILNKAVEQSLSEYIIQIDGDVLLHPSFIKDHISAAEKNAFVRGTRARLSPEKTQYILRTNDINLKFYSKGVYNRFNALHLPALAFAGQRKEMNSRSVRGSNLAYWKKDFEHVNGYNNELSGWGHEDEELATRFINGNIIKKIVKLRAIQYHLDHLELPRSNEPEHRQIIQQMKEAKIIKCANGYENVH